VSDAATGPNAAPRPDATPGPDAAAGNESGLVPVVSPSVPAVPAGGDLVAPDPGSWDLDLAAATLSMDTGDTEQLFEALGGKLERILGARVQIQREGGFRRKHRIGRIVVDTGEGRLEATRSRTGPVFLLVHAVRGITLQTAEISADDWLARLVAMVGQEASRSGDVRSALGRLLET
jgi:hypothetical protein